MLNGYEKLFLPNTKLSPYVDVTGFAIIRTLKGRDEGVAHFKARYKEWIDSRPEVGGLHIYIHPVSIFEVDPTRKNYTGHSPDRGAYDDYVTDDDEISDFSDPEFVDPDTGEYFLYPEFPSNDLIEFHRITICGRVFDKYMTDMPDLILSLDEAIFDNNSFFFMIQ